MQDKRFWLTAGTILSAVLLSGLGKPLNEQTLTFLGLTLAAFMGQSQWGQTRRTLWLPPGRCDSDQAALIALRGMAGLRSIGVEGSMPAGSAAPARWCRKPFGAG